MLCSSGFYISWYVSLQSIRDSQREAVNNSNFHKGKIINFVFSRTSIEQNRELNFENADEFEYNNCMYDVINKKTVGDSIYVTCISDTEEDNLKDVAIAQILRTGNNSTGKELPILKFRIDHYTNDLKNISCCSVGIDIFQTYKNAASLILPAPYLNISSPPPWSCV